MSESSRARQRRRRETSGSTVAGVAGSAAKGDVPSQNAPVVRRQLPANVGQPVNNEVVGRSHGNGDVRRGSDAADDNVKPGRRKSAADISRQSSGDAKPDVSKSYEHGDNILSNVSHLSHLLAACTFCLLPPYCVIVFIKLAVYCLLRIVWRRCT